MRLNAITQRRYKIFGVDDVLIGAAISGLGSIFTNQSNQQNNSATNFMNMQLAGAANAQNALEAEKNRNFQAAQVNQQQAFNQTQAQANINFQEKMSSTAYQRAMQDMKSAGLNPILAYQKGGSSTPGGAQATVGAASGAQATATPARVSAFQRTNDIAEAVNTGLSLRRANQEVLNMRYQQQQIEQQTAESIARENNINADSRIKAKQLHGADRDAVIADIDKESAQTSAYKGARKVGNVAEQVERTVAPIVNTAKGVTQAVMPWKSFGLDKLQYQLDKLPRETTRSGTRWNKDRTEENHYQESTFSKRWTGD